MDNNKPLMKKKEISLVTEVLQKLKPIRCLEWGSGNSTIYFSSIVSAISKKR